LCGAAVRLKKYTAGYFAQHPSTHKSCAAYGYAGGRLSGVSRLDAVNDWNSKQNPAPAN